MRLINANLHWILIAIVVFSNFNLHTQITKDLGVWNITGECIHNSKGIYSLAQIDSIVSTLPFGIDSVIMVYQGTEISNIRNYKLNREHFKISYFVSQIAGNQTMQLNNFLAFNDTLDRYMNTDTMLLHYCIPYRDSIPDGNWIRYVHNDRGMYRNSMKTILNGLFEGESLSWLPDGRISSRQAFSKGYKKNVEAFYVSKEDGLHEYQEYQCNILTKRIILDSLWSLVEYYEYDGAYYSIVNKKLALYGSFYKNVYHGVSYEFDLITGKISSIIRHEYGKFIDRVEINE